MKQIFKLTMVALLFATASCAQNNKDQKDNENMGETKVSVKDASYAFGVNVGESLKNLNIENFDISQFKKGFEDKYNGKTEMTGQESGAKINAFLEALNNEKMEKNLAKGKEFLEKNAKEEGVITLESGLQYKIIEEGTGEYPTADSEVEVHYTGTLMDGREFDSSHSRNQTAKFPLSGVIRGWTEGLQKVKEGGKIKLFVPADLAYGDRAMQGSIIEPNSTLIFEVELIKITK